MLQKSSNIVWHEQSLTKELRRKQNGHNSFVLWFTGLSGSGKSTVANAVAKRLFDEGIKNYVLDGDNVRHGLNKDLGFSEEDRKENIRRIGEVSKLFVDGGQVVLTAFISPFAADRELVRSLLEDDEFVEVYIKCPIEECEKRDPKGLYVKARQGIIRDFTGIDSPYEEPVNPELTIETNAYSIEDSVEKIIEYLKKRNFIS
ncbi:adenylyl-sulfate kinase [Neobacillus ginsengisoli]|uniref:Adenylyl-sulfate kinase n=1 Tax=Neobacillus ginsengisoli TaxID=904295 RepID=A0ABT9Y235_9BACI|nr:adenylyl-sulfate kinase [Neobacillus ginsengisoli]MDQ0201806.1 adenylylsulfate kinase [Neobacillus ginsengisoli]